MTVKYDPSGPGRMWYSEDYIKLAMLVIVGLIVFVVLKRQ